MHRDISRGNEDMSTFNEKNIENILESFYDGIWITNGAGVVLYTNKAWERISGVTREEVIGKTTQELLDKKLFSHSVTFSVLEKRQRVTMMGFTYRTGKHTLTTGTPIFDDQGNIAYVVNNVRDITDLTNMKKELENKEELIAQQQNELALLRSLQLNSPFGVVISSRQMKKVMEMSVHVGKFDCTVLIQGESGVGKEIIAQTIVQSSERKEGPFIKINCGAIPETLLESELFGYEKGAFTGADPKGKTGMFEMANKGTILLDEVGEIPISLQVKLLRVLQEKEIIRVGGTKPIKLNIRIIAATNQNLEEMVREGTFREDLYYRINVVSIIIPPLRKRPDDIPALTKHFLHKFNKKYNLNKSISPQLQDLLLTYPWPGNVRELQNLIENLVILTQDDVITPEHLPAKFLEHRNNVTPNLVEINKILPLKEAVNILETNLIKEAMQRFGTTRRAASILKVDQSTLP